MTDFTEKLIADFLACLGKQIAIKVTRTQNLMSNLNTSSPIKGVVRLCLDGKEYLSSQSDEPIKAGFMYGNYFGSSTRLSGGDIWHPQTGYNTMRISLEIKSDGKTSWTPIFDQVVNFCEELVKIKESAYSNYLDLEITLSHMDQKTPDLERILNNHNQMIAGIRNGSICNVSTGSHIELKNKSYIVFLDLRDLHRFECEVQISGCRYKSISEDHNKS